VLLYDCFTVTEAFYGVCNCARGKVMFSCCIVIYWYIKESIIQAGVCNALHLNGARVLQDIFILKMDPKRSQFICLLQFVC